MDDLSSLVLRARGGDADAYELLVRRFQDMAFGYGYSILKDFQLAEDAAQEAFLEAYRNLPKLREPAAFPGWFRRIVFKQCDRMIRGASILMVPLDGAEARAALNPDPSEQAERAELLLDSGIELDIYQASAIGETETVEEWLRKDPNLLNSFSPEGATPLHLAAHFGHRETLEFLLLRGADKNVISRHEIQVTPLHAALYGRRTEIAKILLSHGADVTIKRGGKNWPRAGWTALHYAAGCGFVDLVEPMLDLGADIHARDDEGRTPFSVALEESQDAVAEILRRRGAQQ